MKTQRNEMGSANFNSLPVEIIVFCSGFVVIHPTKKFYNMKYASHKNESAVLK